MIRRLEIWVAVLCIVMFVRTEARASETGQTEGGEESSFTVELEEELIDSLELEGVQNMIDDMLGKNDFSFKEALKKLMTGKEVLSKEAAWELLRGLFSPDMNGRRGRFSEFFFWSFWRQFFQILQIYLKTGRLGQ